MRERERGKEKDEGEQMEERMKERGGCVRACLHLRVWAGGHGVCEVEGGFEFSCIASSHFTVMNKT